MKNSSLDFLSWFILQVMIELGKTCKCIVDKQTTEDQLENKLL